MFSEVCLEMGSVTQSWQSWKLFSKFYNGEFFQEARFSKYNSSERSHSLILFFIITTGCVCSNVIRNDKVGRTSEWKIDVTTKRTLLIWPTLPVKETLQYLPPSLFLADTDLVIVGTWTGLLFYDYNCCRLPLINVSRWKVFSFFVRNDDRDVSWVLGETHTHYRGYWHWHP